MSIASGSSGNCYYLSADNVAVLIDAGVGIRTLKKALKERDIRIEDVSAVFVTHDHADHIKAAGYLGEKIGIPVYATADTHRGINASYCTKIKLGASARTIEKGVPFELGAFRITPFEVPHDATDNVGYYIEAGGLKFVFMTDLGMITDEAANYARLANYLVIEANYDLSMLEMGPYSQLLKARIKSGTGHLCNRETASFLAENYSGHLRHVWLCHLSKDNNHPELAYKTVELALQANNIIVGKDLQLTVLKRYLPSDLYVYDTDVAE